MSDGSQHEPFPLSRDLQVATAIGQLKASMTDVSERLELNETETRLCRREVAELTAFLKESLFAGDLAPRGDKPRTSVAAHAVNLGKYSAVVVGLLGVAVQVASIWRPDLKGPLTELVKMFGG